MLLIFNLFLILLYIYQDGEEAPYNQQWVSMTERFRYPPKGYASHIPTSNSGAVGAPPVATTSRVSESDAGNPQYDPTLKKALTSIVSQKIQMDRMQTHKAANQRTREISGLTRLKNENGSRMRH